MSEREPSAGGDTADVARRGAGRGAAAPSRSESAAWEAWARGEDRCPYCIGLDMRDFEACCDCSRFSIETTGEPITIQVIGRPDTAVTVGPPFPPRGAA